MCLGCLVVVLLFAVDASAQLLYKITGKGIKEPSYLFATHHAVPLSLVKNVDNVFKCYNRCDAVVSEMVLNEDSVAAAMLAKAQMTSSIRNFLTDIEYSMVDSALKAVIGIGLADIAYLRPSMIENMYLLSVYEKYYSTDETDTSMDSFFQNVAIQQNKPIYGLETADRQLDLLLYSQPVPQQAKQLVNTVSGSLSALHADIDRLNELYLDAQLDSIAQWTLDTEGFTPDEYARLVVERNTDWLDKIEEYIHAQPCFIAVGALHLPTPDGLLHQLEKRGYRVSAVDR